MLEGAGAASGGCRGLMLVPAWLWEGLTGTLRGDQLHVAFTSPGVRSFPGGGGALLCVCLPISSDGKH